jgi:hypothetical protein
LFQQLNILRQCPCGGVDGTAFALGEFASINPLARADPQASEIRRLKTEMIEGQISVLKTGGECHATKN